VAACFQRSQKQKKTVKLSAGRFCTLATGNHILAVGLWQLSNGQVTAAADAL
jgi:hypothetical protein